MIRISALAAVLVLCLFDASAQKWNSWFVYGHSKFVHSIGLEADVPVYKQLGIHGGVSAFYQDYDTDRVINADYHDDVGFFNANLGLSVSVLQRSDHMISVSCGYKLYFGPDYQPLIWYEEGAYYIWFDASRYIHDFGFDFSIFYSYKRITAIVKFDTARNNFHFGLGYRFGKKNSDNTINVESKESIM